MKYLLIIMLLAIGCGVEAPTPVEYYIECNNVECPTANKIHDYMWPDDHYIICEWDNVTISFWKWVDEQCFERGKETIVKTSD
jgi:hypothetical protein